MPDELERVRQNAFNLLMAPWMGQVAIGLSIGINCAYFEHPLTPRGERCPCGKVRTKKDSI
jgi:hypothetical protein